MRSWLLGGGRLGTPRSAVRRLEAQGSWCEAQSRPAAWNRGAAAGSSSLGAGDEVMHQRGRSQGATPSSSACVLLWGWMGGAPPPRPPGRTVTESWIHMLIPSGSTPTHTPRVMLGLGALGRWS